MRARRALGGARRTESGETLIEVLMTVAVIAIAFVAILGAIFTAIRMSDYHRKTTTADLVLRNFAETLKQPVGTYHYVACAAAGATVSYPAYTPPAPYSGYTATITQIRYLNGYNADGSPHFDSTCPSADQGLQELTLKASGPVSDPTVRGNEQVILVKRDATGDTP